MCKGSEARGVCTGENATGVEENGVRRWGATESMRKTLFGTLGKEGYLWSASNPDSSFPIIYLCTSGMFLFTTRMYNTATPLLFLLLIAGAPYVQSVTREASPLVIQETQALSPKGTDYHSQHPGEDEKG